MGGSSTTLSIVLKLVDDASAAMAGVASKLQADGEAMMSQGRSLTLGLTLPIVGAATAVSKMAMDYQTATEQLVTNAGYSQAATDQLSQSVLQFAASGQAQQSAYSLMHDGLYHIASLGVPAANAMDVLTVASTGAAIGGASLDSVSSALGASIASNIKGTSNYSDAMATLIGIVGSGNMRMQDLADSIGHVLPFATTAGLSLKDIGAAMATMTDNGLPAADAATTLSHTIAMMAAPIPKAIKDLKSIGMTQFELADDMRSKGLIPALQDLEGHLKSSGKTADQQAAIISGMFGGARTGAGMELLLNNLDRLNQKTDTINAGISDYQQKIIAQGQTAGATFAEMQASISASGVELGNALLPLEAQILPRLAMALQAVTGWFTSLSPQLKDAVITMFAVAAAAGPVEFIFGAMVTAVGFLLTPFGLFLVTITGLALVFERFHTQIAAFFTTLNQNTGIITLFKEEWQLISEQFKTQLLPALVQLWNALLPLKPYLEALGVVIGAALLGAVVLISQALTVAVSLFTGLLTVATNIATFFTNVLVGAINAVAQALEAVINAFHTVASFGGNVAGAIGGAFNNTIHAFASGGIVTGPTLALVGEAGPEAIIPLSAFAGGNSLAGAGFGGGAGMVINITGNNISSQLDVRNMAQQVGAEIVRVLRLNGKYSI